jgi:hypothetical protein
MTNVKLTGVHARWAHILSEYDFEIKHRPGKRSGDADGLSRNPLQDETDLTDARMDHEPSSVSPISVSAGLALLAYQGAEISKVDENQSRIKEDFALAIPEKDAPFSGTERDGELVLQNPRTNPISRDIWLDPGTLRYLRDKTFEEGASAQERDRVQHRANGYYFMNKLLRKRTSPLTGKIDKVVPPPRERTNLISRHSHWSWSFRGPQDSLFVGADLLLEWNVCTGPQGSFFLHGLRSCEGELRG